LEIGDLKAKIEMYITPGDQKKTNHLFEEEIRQAAAFYFKS